MQNLKENSRRHRISDIPSGYAIRIKHLHDGNDPDRTIRKAISRSGKRHYMTLCRIVERDTKIVVAAGVAICSRRDTPSRELGHAIALGRAILAFKTPPEDEVEGEAQVTRLIPALRLVRSNLA